MAAGRLADVLKLSFTRWRSVEHAGDRAYKTADDVEMVE